MIILGIDPGFERMGCTVLEKSPGGEKLIYSSCLISSRNDAHEKRLLVLAEGLKKIIKDFKPDIVAIEKLFFRQPITKNQHRMSVFGAVTLNFLKDFWRNLKDIGRPAGHRL